MSISSVMKLKSWENGTLLMAVLSLSFVMAVNAAEDLRGESVENPALGDWRPFKESSRGFDPRANLDLVPNAEFEVSRNEHSPIVRVNMLKIKDWTAVPGIKKSLEGRLSGCKR